MFKPQHQLRQPDPLVAGTSGRDGSAPITLEEQHDCVAGIQLSSRTPQEVLTAFDAARNAFVYAWFSYDLAELAEAQAFKAVELAMRLRLGARAQPKDTFTPLIQKAVKDGLLKDPPGGPPLTLALRLMRNDRAHPSRTRLNPAQTVMTLELCSQVITELYP